MILNIKSESVLETTKLKKSGGHNGREEFIPVNVVFIVVGAVVIHNKHQFLHIQTARTHAG